MDLRMNGKCGRVHRPVAVHDLTTIVDQDEVLHADLLEVHPEGVDPEVIEELGIACGDVTCDSFVESELSEQTESGGEALLAVPPLVFDVVEPGELRRKTV